MIIQLTIHATDRNCKFHKNETQPTYFLRPETRLSKCKEEITFGDLMILEKLFSLF